MILMKNWLRVEWSLFLGWSLILKLGQISRVNDPYRKSAIGEGWAKDHDPYKIKMSVDHIISFLIGVHFMFKNSTLRSYKTYDV